MRKNILSLLVFPIFLAGLCLLFLSVHTQASPKADPSDLLFQNSASNNLSQSNEILYQSEFFSTRIDASNRQVQWIGDLQAIAIDSFGNPRSLWSAGQQLSELENVLEQRQYATPANTGRHIFTYLDLNTDGRVDDGEIRDFMPETFSQGSHGILDIGNVESAGILVNYIRGDDSLNAERQLRNRTLDLDGDGNAKVMRLGDIVHSRAIEVGAPSEAYDLLYDDVGYGKFRRQYSARRKVVYVGANDGMVHAFNAGFYDPRSRSHGEASSHSAVQHPLGSELWAYVPYNLLPQLKLLQAPDYAHAWYMDGSPRIFDAKIFAEDQTHPGGWGTVMVIGMRFGGSRSRLDAKSNNDGFRMFKSGSNPSFAIQTQSAYVLMDITDPEQKPVLMAEITDPDDMGYSISRPAILAFGKPGNKTFDADNRWHLVFGSGPQLADSGTTITASTDRTAKLYVYDLVKRQFITKDKHAYLHDLGDDPQTGAAGSFVGNPVAVDWDLDYQADAVYFGTVAGNEIAPDGKLFKLDLNPFPATSSAAPVVLSNPRNPVIAAPTVTKDEAGNHWIIAGTGRLYTEADRHSTQVQSLFAVIDSLPAQTPSYENLVLINPSGAGTLENKSQVASSTAVLEKLILSKKGWKRALRTTPGTAAERSLNGIPLLGGTLFAVTFAPDDAEEKSGGKSRLYCLDYKTGTAGSDNSSCINTAPVGSASEISEGIIDLGPGQANAPSLYLSRTASADLSVLTGTSTGAINQISAQTRQNIQSGGIDWRELNR